MDTTRADIDSETYEWLTQRFGERVAEALTQASIHNDAQAAAGVSA